MATIEMLNDRPWKAASACGRVAVRTNHHGDVDSLSLLDGRQVWRGSYMKDGLATDERVSESDWALVVQTFGALDDAVTRHRKIADEAYYAKLDARHDHLAGIEAVRGGAYDPDCDGPYGGRW